MEAKIVLSSDTKVTIEKVEDSIKWVQGKIPDQAMIAIIHAMFDIDLLVEIADNYGRILYISQDGAWFDGQMTTLDGIDGGLPTTGMVEIHDILKNAHHDAVLHYDARAILADDENYTIVSNEDSSDEIEDGKPLPAGIPIPYYWVSKGKL